ncbi:putative transcriptional regulator [Mesorhizobium sp. USDA 4775]
MISFPKYNAKGELTYLLHGRIDVPTTRIVETLPAQNSCDALPVKKGAYRRNSCWGLKTMDIVETPSRNNDALIELTADVVAAYVSNNPVPVGELPNLISDVHAALGRVGGTAEQPPADKQKPAVNPKRSVHDDYIVCLEDGKKFKSLKRHLMTHYDLTPEQYREKWNLDPSYPMVAPNYAAARSQLAKKMGLGRKRKAR